MISTLQAYGQRWMRARLHTPILVLTLLALSLAPASGQSPEADHSLYLPVIADTTPYCRHRAPGHIFGVQMYGDTSPRNRFHEPLVESGAAWMRVPLEWREIEPSNTTPDKYDWRAADNAVGAATFECIEIILTFSLAPGWAAPCTRCAIPENRHADVAQFLAAVVERYDGDGIDDAPAKTIVNYIEMYNEPDGSENPQLSTWGRNGALYGKMLAAATPKMRQANPNVKVLFGGIAYERFTTDAVNPGPFVETFVDDAIKAGGAPYFDIMNFHYYPSFAPRWNQHGPGLLGKTAFLRDKLAGLGVTDKPFMVTETGWHSNSDEDQPSNDETQMRHVVRLLTQAKVADLDSVIYFSFSDPGGDYPYATGLVTSGNPPAKKPSYTTYRMMIDVLGPARFDRIVPMGVTNASDMEAYEFTNTWRNAKIYVAWLNPIQTTTKKSLVLSGEQATVRSVRNVQSTVLDTNDGRNDGRLTFEVTGRPIMIEIPQ